ncbi:hypothetical protein pesp035 [Peridroma alphabaculovirus]|uniref:Uncharacterized protein n=1 Tax=Peridroma alphabaculovirus TaxID=1346829 RepID=A0A068LMJ3_9ABAC|nr:hypothetical protein pesp035 [Peridroma alphabaculovirus]AIE47766.1 hypothetical protein pesp035 [Peridroma alphabaculovirus]
MEQFKLLSVQHEVLWKNNRGDHFGACQYIAMRKASMAIMLTVRLGSAFIVSLLLAFGLYAAPDRRDYWIYYSHWSLVLLLFMFLLGANTSLRCLLHQGNAYDIGCGARWQWLLFNVACTANIVSSIVYFVITFTYKGARKNEVNHVVHTFNSLLVVVELINTAVPVRLHHVYQPLAYTVGYGLFAAVYHYFTGHPIYQCLRWGDAEEMAKVSISFMVLLFIVYMLIYTSSFVKRKCNINYS